ncbi:hypothetical protein TL16_g07271, partial [Triparma laevis f. inornata]
MIVSEASLRLLYDQSVASHHSSSKPIIVAVNPTVDGLCSARILCYMLRLDSCTYSLHYLNCPEKLDRLVEDSNNSTIYLLNCGTKKPIPESDNSVYCISTLRPVNLRNVHAELSSDSGVAVAVGEFATEDEVNGWLEGVPEDGDYLTDGEDTDSDSDSDSESEEEEEEDLDEGEAEADLSDEEDVENPAKRARIEEGEEGANTTPASPNPQDDGEDNGEAKEEEEEEEEEPKLKPSQISKQRITQIQSYYSSGLSHGPPSSYVLFRLACGSRFDASRDLLWYAMVGVSAQHNAGLLDDLGYQHLHGILEVHRGKLFPLAPSRDPNNVLLSSDGLTQISTSAEGHILRDESIRSLLLTNWNLWDSLFYSQYIGSKLECHLSRGENKLKELLAKMGYPLSSAKQPYSFMSVNSRRNLKSLLQRHSTDYGLEDVLLYEFKRVTGYNSVVSDSDVAHAVQGLIDHNKDYAEAYDALNCRKGEEGTGGNVVNSGAVKSGISLGIQLAKQSRVAVINAGSSMIEKQEIVTYKHFRFAYIHASSSSANGQGARDENTAPTPQSKDAILSSPMVVNQLGRWLVDLHLSSGKWTGRKAKPLIILSENPSKRTYTASAFNCLESVANNRFSSRFEMAAKQVGGKREEVWEDWCWEIENDKVQGFVQQLHLILEQ